MRVDVEIIRKMNPCKNRFDEFKNEDWDNLFQELRSALEMKCGFK